MAVFAMRELFAPSIVASSYVFAQSYRLQMLWVATMPDFAQMVKRQSIWDWAFVVFIHFSMYIPRPGNGVAIVRKSLCPKPTAIRLFV